jgi:hypothetical protein
LPQGLTICLFDYLWAGKCGRQKGGFGGNSPQWVFFSFKNLKNKSLWD